MNEDALRKFFNLEPRESEGEQWCDDCQCVTNHRGPHPDEGGEG